MTHLREWSTNILKFAYLFSPTIHETLKQLTDTGFVYYTLSSRHRHIIKFQKWWHFPLGNFHQFLSFPNLNRNGKGRPNDFERLRRQLRKACASANCTKPKYQRQRWYPGVPIFAYATPDPPQQPLNFSAMVDQTPRLARTESIAPSGAACRAILFQANSVLIVKRDHIRRQSGVATSGPFFIGSLKTDVSEDDHESYFDLQFYVPSFQDCLNFIHHGKVNVHRDAVICAINETEIQTGHYFIKLSTPAHM